MTNSNISEHKDADFQTLGLLKFELLSKGMRVSESARGQLLHLKYPIRTRSGASGGLDITLPFNIHVNIPISEKHTKNSELLLDFIDDTFSLFRGDLFVANIKVDPIPEYYLLETIDGIPMKKIGQMCSSDRFCYGMTGAYCWFWKPERRCKYCSIGLNHKDDYGKKSIERLLSVLEYAVSDPRIPAKHVLVGGGTPKGDDMGAILASEICLAIKKRFDLSCYVMISAPLKNDYIDLLYDSGADELGMNLEFFSADAWSKYIPGKDKYIGRRRYLDALEYSVKKFGPVNTRSILMVGLERYEDTILGVETLASLGVMPILSSFRGLEGTELEFTMGFDHLKNYNLYLEACSKTANYGIPIGPTCIACQNNVLALPLPSEHYRYY